MKTAKLTVEAVSVLCPECNEAIPNQANGSLLWTREDFGTGELTCQCSSCDATVKVVFRKTVPFQ